MNWTKIIDLALDVVSMGAKLVENRQKDKQEIRLKEMELKQQKLAAELQEKSRDNSFQRFERFLVCIKEYQESMVRLNNYTANTRLEFEDKADQLTDSWIKNIDNYLTGKRIALKDEIQDNIKKFSDNSKIQDELNMQCFDIMKQIANEVLIRKEALVNDNSNLKRDLHDIVANNNRLMLGQELQTNLNAIASEIKPIADNGNFIIDK